LNFGSSFGAKRATTNSSAAKASTPNNLFFTKESTLDKSTIKAKYTSPSFTIQEEAPAEMKVRESVATNVETVSKPAFTDTTVDIPEFLRVKK